MNGTAGSSFVGAIDQGTTSSRFLIFNNSGEVVVTHQLEFTQIYPQPGYVNNKRKDDNIQIGKPFFPYNNRKLTKGQMA